MSAIALPGSPGRRISAALLGLCLLILTAACTEAPVPQLRVAGTDWLGYQPLFVARDLGEFPPGTIHLVELPSSTEVMRAYRNGTIDGAALTLDEFLLLRDQGFDPRIVLIMDVSQGADSIIGRAGIDSLSGVVGKRVGVEDTAVGGFVLSRALEQHGLAPDQVTIVPVEYSEHLTALQPDDEAASRVDAVVTYEPVRSQLLGKGGTLLWDSSEIPGEIVDVLVVRAAIMAERPGQVADLIAGWFRALRYQQTQRDEFNSRIMTGFGFSIEEVELAYAGIHFPDLAENRRMLSSGAAGLAAGLARVKRYMLASKLLQQDVSVQGVFTDQLLPGVSPR